VFDVLAMFRPSSGRWAAAAAATWAPGALVCGRLNRVRSVGGATMRRVCVVANRTLGGDPLLEVIKARVAEGPCEFTLLVPAGRSRGDASARPGEWQGAARQAGGALLPGGAGYDEANRQLDYGLSWIRQQGAP
jgi:hypothetical protein